MPTFNNIFAIDPTDLTKVASNAEVVIFAPGDAAKTPLVLTDVDGLPLPNPITTSEHGFGPAFIAPLDQVAWAGGGLSNIMESYSAVKDIAVAAQADAALSAQASASSQAAAEAAGVNAGTEAAAQVSLELGAARAAAEQAALDAATAKDEAIAAAGLVEAPAGDVVVAAVSPGGAADGVLSAKYASISFVEEQIETRSEVGHSHAIEDVIGLPAALDGKQPAGSYATTQQLSAKADATALATGLAGKSDTGHEHLAATAGAAGFMSAADKAKLDGADAAYKPATNRMFEGASLYSYGHSWTTAPSSYCTPNTGEYQARLARRLELGAVTSHGMNGAYMMDMAAAIMCPTINGKDRRLAAGSRGIVLLQCLINDLVSGSAVPAAAESVNAYKHMLRTFLAAASAGSFQDRDSGTFVGSWADSSAGVAQWYPAGKLKQANALGATASWSVSGDTAWVHCSASTAALSSGAWTARVNGVVVGSFSPQGVLPSGLVSPWMGSRADLPVAVKVTGMNAAAGTSGNKTLTITTNEAKNTYLSGVSTPAVNPPRIFVALEAPRNPAASGMAAWNTWEPIYRQAIIDVVAEFPNVSTVDLAPGWINPDFIRSTDGQLAHANDLGMAHISSRFEAAIRSTVSTPNPGVLAL